MPQVAQLRPISSQMEMVEHDLHQVPVFILDLRSICVPDDHVVSLPPGTNANLACHRVGEGHRQVPLLRTTHGQASAGLQWALPRFCQHEGTP